VWIVTDGQKGVELASHCHPDLILLDVLMPGINGFDLLKDFRGHEPTRGIPIVMLTALSDPESLKKANSFSCEGYLVKPVTIEALRFKIDSVLTRISGKNDRLKV
jgi:CheY-like chemotaxis protein